MFHDQVGFFYWALLLVVNMKDLEKSVELCFSAEDAFQYLFMDSAAVSEYHSKQGHTKGLTVGEWNDQQRKINFCMPVKLPDSLKSLIGVDVITVTECQSYERHGDGKILVHSIPLPDFTGAANFETKITFTLVPSESNNEMCVMTGRVECTCKGYWGLQSTIESQMISASDVELGSFMEFCQSYCQRKLLPMDNRTFSEDEFFEAYETASQSSFGSQQQNGGASYLDRSLKSNRSQQQPLREESATTQLSSIDQSLKSIVKLLEQGVSQGSQRSSTMFVMSTFLCGVVVGSTAVILVQKMRKQAI
eukprot:TRINITY_DN23008_c0_g1_i1.p1 TRINITY_DN23008_c0_g1~~TRINITY_DN23008_c0_g1_i1.p1  ORF type:complete len:306 (-),score=31.97 TRINITY_DN23008_c0_g1_i1:496-1413(-)